MHRLSAVLIVLMFVLLAGCENESPKAPESLKPPTPEKAAPEPKQEPSGLKPEDKAVQGANGEAEDVFAMVVEKITPSVVNISTYQSPEDMVRSGRMPEDNYHKRPPRGESSIGTGVIISEDGYIITNSHVVADSTEIKVKLFDETEYEPKLIGADPKTDVAVLKIDSDKPFKAAPLGDSDKLKLGQWAIALGTPFGLEKTVTVGVVSGVGRADVGVTYYENFIQTDASINPGNSGGPLCNSRGEVIGITTAIMSAGQGISFAIPINMARDIATKLIEQGEVVRGWLGVGIQTLTPELADGFGLSGLKGILVNKVFEGTPAEKAGFEVGDVILSFSGLEVDDVRKLQSVVAWTEVGSKVPLTVIRSGKEVTLSAVIGEMGAFEHKAEKKETKAELQASGKLGLTVHSAGIGKDAKGVVIVAVDPGSNAERAGVQVGTEIVSINLEDVVDMEGFKKIADGLNKGETVVLLVKREDSPLFIAYEVQ